MDNETKIEIYKVDDWEIPNYLAIVPIGNSRVSKNIIEYETGESDWMGLVINPGMDEQGYASGYYKNDIVLFKYMSGITVNLPNGVDKEIRKKFSMESTFLIMPLDKIICKIGEMKKDGKVHSMPKMRKPINIKDLKT